MGMAAQLDAHGALRIGSVVPSVLTISLYCASILGTQCGSSMLLLHDGGRQLRD